MSSVDLTWTVADTVGAPRIERYAVYRAAGESDFGLLQSLPVLYSALFEDAEIPLSYSDDAVSDGVTYRYYVTAFDCYDRELRSNIVEFTVTISPGSVTLEGFNIDSGTNKLDWTSAAAGTYPIAGYRLYYSGGTLVVDTLDPATLIFDDTGLVSGDYTYYVVAYDTHGNVSAHSNQITLTVPSADVLVAYVRTSADFFNVTPSTSMSFNLVNANVTDEVTFPNSVIFVTLSLATTGTPPAITSFSIGGINVPWVAVSADPGFLGGKYTDVLAMVRIPPGGLVSTTVAINWAGLNLTGTVVKASANAFYNVDPRSDDFGLLYIAEPVGAAPATSSQVSIPARGGLFVSNIQYTGGDVLAEVISAEDAVAYSMIGSNIAIQLGHYYYNGYRIFADFITLESLVPASNSDGFRPVIGYVMAPFGG